MEFLGDSECEELVNTRHPRVNDHPQAIEKWLSMHNTSPMTGAVLAHRCDGKLPAAGWGQGPRPKEQNKEDRKKGKQIERSKSKEGRKQYIYIFIYILYLYIFNTTEKESKGGSHVNKPST